MANRMNYRKEVVRSILQLLALFTFKVITLTLLFFVCLLLFYSITHDVFVDRDTAFDNMLFALADQVASPDMTRIMRVVSFFGSYEYLMIIPPLVVIIFAFNRNMHWHSLRVLFITFISSVLNQWLKLYYARPRPLFPLVDTPGFSYPSGHAMIGGVFYGLLIYVVWVTVLKKTWRWVIILLLTILVLLIGFSRIYLRVHYATDVVAGYAIGLVWLFLSLYLLVHIEKMANANWK